MSNRNNFNFLRIFAAILVAITHSYAITGHAHAEFLHSITNGKFYLSSVGLYIFFFTSGYLVSLSAANSKSPWQFLKKRILRIYPALIILTIVSVFVAGPLLTKLSFKNYFTDSDTWQYLWTATGFRIRFMLPGVFEQQQFPMAGFNGSLWSLTLELELYSLLFILLLIGIFKNKKWLMITLTALLIACLLLSAIDVRTVLLPNGKGLLLAATFLFGGILQSGFIPKKYFLPLFALSALMIFLKSRGILAIDILIDEVVFFSLATYFIAFTNLFKIKIKNDISYGIYIYTFPLQQMFFQFSGFSQSVIINLLLSLMCSSILALISWRYIEKPALRYKN
ncbi:MAG: acyltransferase [Ginsengibacter sp.]